MKANIALEINKNDLNYELEKLVTRIASEEIEIMVREQAQQMVKEEVKKIISPIVDSYLNNAVVGEEYQSYHSSKPPRSEVDKYIKRVLQDYLDEPCYEFSKSSSKLSEKYRPSASGGTRTTRAEHWIADKARKYVDEELFKKMEMKIEETVKLVTPNEEEVQEIIKREIREKFN
ncbi:hypothetical protein ACFSMW_06765 [Virgibacillus halophilus]|uniref:Uncharacterized protein n=1 Tax=Tigheibacillus halophilus TaxID=361280 RepID=A0ABU5C600_9BACI|nr:hypothetical protein [Virgibacillus halophilus]